MSIIHRMRPLALALSFALALPALAQEAPAPDAPQTAPAPGDAPVADGLSMGADPAAPADGIGATYTAASFDAWDQRCVRTADGADPCQLYQLLKDASGNPVAEISIFGLPEGQQAAAGATIVAPLETLLTEQLLLQVDTAKGKVYPFTWCSTIGCVARVGFTAEEVAAFKKGVEAKITIVPVVAPKEKVILTVSLKGFTAGFEAVNAANTAADAKAKPAGN